MWVRDLIEKEKTQNRQTVFDPFTGSGTVLLEGELCNMESSGVESHPFVSRIASAKLQWHEDPENFNRCASSVLKKAMGRQETAHLGEYPKLVEKCFSPTNLSQLDSLLHAWKSQNNGSPSSELIWLTLVSIIRECSYVGTAPWQYVLPKKTKAKTAIPFQAFKEKTHLVYGDMIYRQKHNHGSKARLFQDDARTCSSIPDNWADLVITSPPYANNYDYADATRLEMSFLGEITGWGDLQETVRKYLIRSCTQHVSKVKDETFEKLKDPLLNPIREEIYEVCRKLEIERKSHGGKKAYHTMIAFYFADMARVWKTLRRVTNKNSLVCFVVGDSAPYGVHVPVEKWFGELALSFGFKSYHFEKTRDRNVKWKNRKHNVPLHEGRLWVDG